MSRRFSSGSRRLARQLGRRLNLRLGTWVVVRLDGRAFRPPDYWSQACGLLERYLRLRQQASRRDPHLFGPESHRYFLDTVRLEQKRRETEAALEKVYDPDPTGRRPDPKRVWHERYVAAPANQKFFRKWFKEQYGE